MVTTVPVEVLLLTKYDFYHLVDTPTQELMQNYATKFYFDENTIRRSIQKQHTWDAYKRGTQLDCCPAIPHAHPTDCNQSRFSSVRSGPLAGLLNDVFGRKT